MLIPASAHRYAADPCTHNGTLKTYDYSIFSYDYMYDCAYFYNWEGMPIVNNRTMINYTTLTYYVVIYTVAAVIGAVVTFLAVITTLFTKLTDVTMKIYLLTMLFLGFYWSSQFLYRAHCMYAFDANNAIQPHTYASFPCMSEENWPFSGLNANQLLTALWISATYSYYLLTWLAPFHRFMIPYVSARFSRYLRYVPPVSIPLIIILPSIPVLMLNGREAIYVPGPKKNTLVRENILGSYFNPVNNFFYGQYHFKRAILDAGPLLFLLVAPNIGMLLAELTLVRRAQKKANTSPSQALVALNEVKQQIATHTLVTISWLAYGIYGIFMQDLMIKTTVLFWFLVQNFPWFLIVIGNPIVICYYYRSNHRARFEDAGRLQEIHVSSTRSPANE